MVLCTVWLCVSLEVRKMNWEESLLDFQSGLKLTSFSSYECIPLHGYSNLFKIEKPERNWEWCIAAIGSSWLLSLHLLSRLKTGLIHFEAGSTGFLSWLDILTPLALGRWILCTALYGGNWQSWETRLSFLSALFTSHVPSLPALHLQVASWSDKLRQGRGCGSLNQRSLHAFSASSPFFLQRQRKQPRLPTCQEEMSHRQPLDFSQRLFCGPAPRPLTHMLCLHSCPKTHLKATLLVVISFYKNCPHFCKCIFSHWDYKHK